MQCIEERHPVPCAERSGQKGRRGHEHLAEQHEACTDGHCAPATEHPVGEVSAEGGKRVHRARVRPYKPDRFRRRPAETAVSRAAGEKEHKNRKHSVKAETFPEFDANNEPGAAGISQPAGYRRSLGRPRVICNHASKTGPRGVSSCTRKLVVGASNVSALKPSSPSV